MLTLRVVADIDPDKRLEFHQAIKTFQKLSEGDLHRFFQSVDKEDSYCLLMDCQGSEQVEAYLASSQFQFFSGAASVLGEIVTAEIITASEVTPIPNLVSGRRSKGKGDV
jgi:hypothetical protein